MRLGLARARPGPPPARVGAGAALDKRSEVWGKSSRDMPPPVSLTEMFKVQSPKSELPDKRFAFETWDFRLWTLDCLLTQAFRTTVPPAGVWAREFATRLPKTCAMRWGSAST